MVGSGRVGYVGWSLCCCGVVVKCWGLWLLNVVGCGCLMLWVVVIECDYWLWLLDVIVVVVECYWLWLLNVVVIKCFLCDY